MSFRPAPPRDGEHQGEHADDTLRMPRFVLDLEPSSCARVAELVAQAVDGTLPLSLELHLDECGTCTALLREATSLSDDIRRAARGYAHAPDFEARVLAALDVAKLSER